MNTKSASGLNKILLQSSCFALLLLVLSACKGIGKDCSMDNFSGFQLDTLNMSHYRFFDERFVQGLKPGITYRYKDSTQITYAAGKDFTVLSFNAFFDGFEPDLNTMRFGNKESRIKLRTCYGVCSYLKRTLKFKENNPETKVLLLNTFSKGMNKKIHTDSCVYLEGQMKNLGLYLGSREYIFMPYDRYIFTRKDAFYAKILLIKDKNELLTFIFYSNNLIRTDIPEHLAYELKQ